MVTKNKMEFGTISFGRNGTILNDERIIYEFFLSLSLVANTNFSYSLYCVLPKIIIIIVFARNL